MPDVVPYIKNHPGGRFYALAGEGGMVMNTNPKQDDNLMVKPKRGRLDILVNT